MFQTDCERQRGLWITDQTSQRARGRRLSTVVECWRPQGWPQANQGVGSHAEPGGALERLRTRTHLENDTTTFGLAPQRFRGFPTSPGLKNISVSDRLWAHASAEAPVCRSTYGTFFPDSSNDSEVGNGSVKSLTKRLLGTSVRRLRGKALCALPKERTHQKCIVHDDCLVVLSRLGGFGLLDRIQDDGSVGVAIPIAGSPIPKKFARVLRAAERHALRTRLRLQDPRRVRCSLPPKPLSLTLPHGWSRAEATMNCSRCAVQRQLRLV